MSSSSSILGLAAGAQALGGLFNGISAINAGQAAKSAGKAAREAAEANAAVIEELGEQAADEERRVNGRLFASQRVAFAKNNLTAGTGSALDILLDSALEGETIALRRKFGFDSEAFKERLRGIQAEFQGDVTAGAGLAQGAGTILGGVAGGAAIASRIPRVR